MLTFKSVQLEDKNIIEPFIWQSPHQICSFAFANLIMYGEVFMPCYTIENDMLIFWNKINHVFSPPVGKGDVKTTINKMIRYADGHNFEFALANITQEMKEKLESIVPNMFEFDYNDDYSDYLYHRENLAHLQGKKYQPKRNHINQFKKTYHYSYHRMTIDDIPDCLQMHEQWAAIHCMTGNYSLERELCATEKALSCFEKLNLLGGVLRVDAKVIAFTFGQAINADTFDVCVEKALAEYNGAYPMINQLFVEHQLSAFTFVNREEDLGQEGLRKAKLSYHPCAKLIKYGAKLKS